MARELTEQQESRRKTVIETAKNSGRVYCKRREEHLSPQKIEEHQCYIGGDNKICFYCVKVRGFSKSEH